MSWSIRVLWIALYAALPFLSACSPDLQAPVKHFELQAPKPYGYVIGDEIHHRIVVETRQHLSLSKHSIPPLGDLNRWLQLKDTKISVQSLSDGNKTEIDLTYQIFYAPLEVKMLKIPGFTLQFTQHGQVIEQRVPDWYFTISPLHELAIRKEGGQIYLRPNAAPDYLAEHPVLIRLSIYMTVVFLSGCYLAYLYGLLPGLKHRTLFKQANKQLMKLSEKDMGKALSIFHQALNARNRKPLFKNQLEDFYRLQPEFKPLAEEFNWFFTFSNFYFSAIGNMSPLTIYLNCKNCAPAAKKSRGKTLEFRF
ncbi:MAG: nonribosomal peptide synthetase MxaA [Methylococcaceae bacterium]|nr:nonribosomal peptide synthetase MxaA [Methylococcaceae bacterium]